MRNYEIMGKCGIPRPILIGDTLPEPPDPSPSLSRSSPTANGQNQRLREPITHPTTMSKKLCHILFMKHTRGRNDDDEKKKKKKQHPKPFAVSAIEQYAIPMTVTIIN